MKERAGIQSVQTKSDLVSWRLLALLTVAVLAAHLYVLRPTPGAVQVREPSSVPGLRLRSIEAKPAPVVPASPVVVATAAAPVTAPVTTPRALAPPRPVAAAPQRPMTNRALPAEPAVETIVATTATPLADADMAQAPLTTAATFSMPRSVNLRYEVTSKSRESTWHGDAELVWRHDGDQYQASLQINAPLAPMRTQHSTGRITADGLAPTRFSDKVRSEEATHFERDKAKVTFSNNRPEASLLAGMQDRLSVLLQLGAMIAGEPSRYLPATRITVQTASTREAESWIFTVDGEEEILLPGGRINTLKLTREPVREFDQKIELWLAPGMDYVPARLRLTQANGDWLDQQWLATDKK